MIRNLNKKKQGLIEGSEQVERLEFGGFFTKKIDSFTNLCIIWLIGSAPNLSRIKSATDITGNTTCQT
jgi:hypothetical protein